MDAEVNLGNPNVDNYHQQDPFTWLHPKNQAARDTKSGWGRFFLFKQHELGGEVQLKGIAGYVVSFMK